MTNGVRGFESTRPRQKARGANSALYVQCHQCAHVENGSYARHQPKGITSFRQSHAKAVSPVARTEMCTRRSVYAVQALAHSPWVHESKVLRLSSLGYGHTRVPVRSRSPAVPTRPPYTHVRPRPVPIPSPPVYSSSPFASIGKVHVPTRAFVEIVYLEE